MTQPCPLCDEQVKKNLNAKPHPALECIDLPRLFKGTKPRGYQEQDYQCLTCQAKFTHSTNKNDVAWTLWRG